MTKDPKDEWRWNLHPISYYLMTLYVSISRSTGQKWFERRKLLTPTFHFAILKSFLDVFNDQSFIFVKKMEKYADKPEPVNIFPHITHCVLDVICGKLFKPILWSLSSDTNFIYYILYSILFLLNLVKLKHRKGACYEAFTLLCSNVHGNNNIDMIVAPW